MSSCFGGIEASTSVLTRRRRKGRRTLCNCVMTSCSTCLSFRSNHESKSSDDLNISGRRKLRSAHSSCKLFCAILQRTAGERRWLSGQCREGEFHEPLSDDMTQRNGMSGVYALIVDSTNEVLAASVRTTRPNNWWRRERAHNKDAKNGHVFSSCVRTISQLNTS